jgi:hypothetical protein
MCDKDAKVRQLAIESPSLAGGAVFGNVDEIKFGEPVSVPIISCFHAACKALILTSVA